MKHYTAYWVATCIRGVTALVAGVAIAFCSAMSATMLLIPVGIVASLLLLAAHVVVDSAIVLAGIFHLSTARKRGSAYVLVAMSSATPEAKRSPG